MKRSVLLAFLSIVFSGVWTLAPVGADVASSVARASSSRATTLPGDNLSGAHVTASGGVTARTLAEINSDQINVKSFGARGNWTSDSPCAISVGSRVLYCPTASFVSAVAGDKFYLQGAGPSGAPLTGAITSYMDGTHVELSAVASTSTPNYAVYSPATAPTSVYASGTGYAPMDTYTVAGGKHTSRAVLTLATTEVSTLALNSRGSGGSTGSCMFSGTTGRGRKFIGFGTVSTGALSSTLKIVSGGAYTLNPSNLQDEPVNGCGLNGATVRIQMGAASVLATTLPRAPVVPGSYTVPPSTPTSQAATSGSGVHAQFNIRPYQLGGRFLYGGDDTAAISAAAAYAVSAGSTIYFPSGNYGLFSQTRPIPLNNVSVSGPGTPGYGPAVDSPAGANLLIFNNSTPAFSGMSGVNWDGVNVSYPTQDNTTPIPIAFPPTFEASRNFTNDKIQNSVFKATYSLFKVDSAASLGRISLNNVRAYCVRYCGDFESGAPDVLVLSSNNYFGPGGDDNDALYGPDNLGVYTESKGEAFHFDIGSGSYASVDGLQASGFIIQGMRYGFRLLSGFVDVATMNGIDFDSVQTAVSVEGSSYWVTTGMNGWFVYSTNNYDPSQANPVFNFTSISKQSALNISGLDVAYAQGSVIYDQNGAFRLLNVTGSQMARFGESTTGGTYGMYINRSGEVGMLNLTANQIDCDSKYGVILSVSAPARVGLKANSFVSCAYPVVVQGVSGEVDLDDNTSTGTVGRSAVYDLTAGAVTVRDGNDNWWDKNSNSPHATEANSVTLHGIALPAVRAGSSQCGTAPSIVTGSSDGAGAIIVGFSTNGGICPVTFAQSHANPPLCVAVHASTGVTIPSPATTTGFTPTGTLRGGETLSYSCQFFQ